MKLRTALLAALVPGALLFTGCQKASDSLDRLIKDRAKAGPGDEAITVVEESKRVGQPGSVIDSPRPGESSEPYEVLTPSPEPSRRAQAKTPAPAVLAPAPAPSTTAKGGPFTTEAELVKLIRAGKYSTVLKANINPKNASHLYYQGNAAYVLALQKKPDSGDRQKLVLLAEKRFREAGSLETDRTKKARAYLWLGITGYRFRLTEYDAETLSKPLRFVTEKLSDTPYHNDALLYLGLVRAKNNQRESAREFFTLLSKTDPRDRVYDVDYSKFTSPQVAAKHYLNLIGDAQGSGSANPAPTDLQLAPSRRPDAPKDDFLERVEKLHREILGAPSAPGSDAAPARATSNASQAAATLPVEDGVAAIP